jgi:molybdopterin molybdotransferase
VLRELGVEVTNLGIVKDDCAVFEDLLLSSLDKTPYDAIISTGAVSKGKFDFVRGGIESIGARVLFHNVAIRPGHPVLFAILPSRHEKGANGNEFCDSRSTAFFGLPGNPLAAAACLRFFVIPYLRALHKQPPEVALPARLDTVSTEIKQPEAPLASTQMVSKPPHLHVFWHGNLRVGLDGNRVQISSDQGSGKVRPLLASNCWISIPQGERPLDSGDVVDTFPLFPDSLGSDIDEKGLGLHGSIT